VVLKTTYLDEQVRLGKGKFGSRFVFTKGGEADLAGNRPRANTCTLLLIMLAPSCLLAADIPLLLTLHCCMPAGMDKVGTEATVTARNFILLALWVGVLAGCGWLAASGGTIQRTAAVAIGLVSMLVAGVVRTGGQFNIANANT
jgi:hypothetical protein